MTSKPEQAFAAAFLLGGLWAIMGGLYWGNDRGWDKRVRPRPAAPPRQ